MSFVTDWYTWVNTTEILLVINGNNRRLWIFTLYFIKLHSSNNNQFDGFFFVEINRIQSNQKTINKKKAFASIYMRHMPLKYNKRKSLKHFSSMTSKILWTFDNNYVKYLRKKQMQLRWEHVYHYRQQNCCSFQSFILFPCRCDVWNFM